MAPPAQWLPEAAWPDRVPFELQGVGAQSQAIRGELPAVRGRAFIRRHDSEGLEEIELQRKTLWFLPDSDMALIIFTGNAPLTHLLDESIESLMLALIVATRRARSIISGRCTINAATTTLRLSSSLQTHRFSVQHSVRALHSSGGGSFIQLARINEMVGMTCLAVFDLRRI